MLRRLSCLAFALAFAASSAFSASAWSADSFISGGEEYEPSVDVVLSDDLPVPDIYAAPRRAPRMVKVSAADQVAADASTTGKLVVPATLPSSVDGTFEVMSKHYVRSDVAGVKLEQDRWDTVVATLSSGPGIANNSLYIVPWSEFTYSPNLSDPDDMIRGLALFCDYSHGVTPPGYIMTNHAGATGGGNTGRDSWSFTVNYDVSSYNSSAFSLDGIDGFQVGLWTPAAGYYAYPLSVDVLVDGQQVLSLSRGSALTIDFGGYVFSGSKSISTISFRWNMPFNLFVSTSTADAGTCHAEIRGTSLVDSPDALAISFLDGQDVINAQNNKTKDDINKHEEYESQWTGSMTENFNKLDVGNFTFHSGLIAGFAMVSGIFMDLWRGMGDAAVAYVFPLTLGVVLMLLGRISRTGGKRGTEEGDDSS